MSIVLVSIVVPQRGPEVDTWRSYWPAAELRRRGHDCYLLGPGGELGTTGWARDDTVVIHATNHDVGLSGTVRYLKGLGSKVWVQLDDDYRHLDRVQDTEDGRVGWYRELMRDHRVALEAADGLIASTPQVAEAYGPWTQGRTHVIRNYIPRWITERPVRRMDPPTIGWFGMLAAHARDIEWLGSHAKGLRRFGVIGDPAGVERITGRALDYRRGLTAWGKLYRYLGKFSVGIVPVVDDAFNRPKSWIKPVEFAAVGVPTIAARLPAYEESQEQCGTWGHAIPWKIVDTPAEMVETANTMLDGYAGRSGPEEELREIAAERFGMEGPGGDAWEKWAAEVGAT